MWAAVGAAGIAWEAGGSQSIMGECTSVAQGPREEVRSMAMWTQWAVGRSGDEKGAIEDGTF